MFAVAFVMEALLVMLRSLGDLQFQIPEAVGLLLLTGLFYLVSVWLVLGNQEDRTSRGTMLVIVGAAIVFRITLWPLAPAFSDDVFRYRWEGLLQARGGNPYQSRPIDPEWRQLRDETFPRVAGPDAKSGYGPLQELIERWTWQAVSRFEHDPERQAFWFKAPAALFDLGIVLVLGALLAASRLPVERILIYAWSPLPLVEFWATGHNDATAVFFVVLALLLARKQRWWYAFAALGLGAGAKIWPLVLFPIFAGWKSWRPARWYQWSVAIPVTGLLALPYWSNVEENARYMSGFVGGWRNNDSIYGLLLWLTGDQYSAKHLAFAIVGLAVLWVTVRHWPLEKASLTVIVVLLMVSANCHPWYLTWTLPLLGVVPWLWVLLWTTLMPLVYRVVIPWVLLREWQGSTPWRWWIYVPVYGLAAGGWAIRNLRSRRRRAAHTAQESN